MIEATEKVSDSNKKQDGRLSLVLVKELFALSHDLSTLRICNQKPNIRYTENIHCAQVSYNVYQS